MKQQQRLLRSRSTGRADVQRAGTAPDALNFDRAHSGNQGNNQGDNRGTKLHPLRVLMVGPDLDVRGGVSAVERLLICALPAEVTVTHLATMVEGSKLRKFLTFARAMISVAVHLRQRPDVVHIHFASDASSSRKMIIARLALSRGVRVIMHAHGGGYPGYWDRMSNAARSKTLHTLQRVHGLIVLGDHWRDFFVSIGVPGEKVLAMPNPVALPKVLPTRLPRDQVRLVYLGLIAHHKGAFDLVEALAQLSPQCIARLRLVIAGNGDPVKLRELAVRRGVDSIIEIRDWVGPDERDRLLASADAFVLPSYAEGLPMSLLEAMAWGLPPICTPVGSIPEYVHDGVNGMLVQPGAVAQLARTLEQVVADDARRTQMGKIARAAVEPLCLELYAKKMCAIYRCVADTGSPQLLNT